jgi:hypothetical protein
MNKDCPVFTRSRVDACYLYQTGRIPFAPGGAGGCEFSIVTENYILFGCVSKDSDGQMPIDEGPSSPSDVIATIHVSPKPDLKFRLTPGQKNGVLRTILDQNCEVAGTFGDPLDLPGVVTGGLVEECGDLHVTTRILEGDLNLDCQVDLTDDQQIAFRYGAFFGNLLYDPWFDLEPSLKDFDIDIKDDRRCSGATGRRAPRRCRRSRRSRAAGSWGVRTRGRCRSCPAVARRQIDRGCRCLQRHRFVPDCCHHRVRYSRCCRSLHRLRSIGRRTGHPGGVRLNHNRIVVRLHYPHLTGISQSHEVRCCGEQD